MLQDTWAFRYKKKSLSHSSLTAVDLVGGGIVPAVIESIAHKVDVDAAAVSTGELSAGVTGGVRAASLVAVVTAVIGVVADGTEWHTAAIVTGEVHCRAGVKGLAGETTESALMVKDDKVSVRFSRKVSPQTLSSSSELSAQSW